MFDDDEVSWRDFAACKTDPEVWILFFPDSPPENSDGDPAWHKRAGNDKIIALREAQAKRICEGCPVKDICLEDALNDFNHNRHGIRGGFTAKERAKLLRVRYRGSVGIHISKGGDYIHAENN